MGTVDKKLNNYIWDNLSKLKPIFSDRVYKSLLKNREEKDKEGFTNTLELIVDLDSDFFDKIKKNLTIDEVSQLLYITPPYDNFEDKKQYINRAEYWVENYGKKDYKYSLLLNNLGRVYIFLYEFDKAEQLLNKALEIREEILGENHHDTATSYNDLANLYDFKGEYDKSEPLYTKALKIREELLGENHPDTAISYNNLALLYELIDEYDKSEPLYEKALKVGENKNIHSNFDSFMQDLNRLFFLNNRNSNLIFKIDSLKVKNFKQYKKPFFIEFSKQVNIIVGQNAIGKTTLLQAITLGLLKEDILDARELDYNNYITKNENESKIVIGHNGDRKKVVKIKKDKREIDDNYFIPFVLAYGSNFFTRYNVSADKIVTDILDKTIHKGIANSIFKDYIDEFWNPLTILNELDRSEHPKAKKKSKIFCGTINRFLDEYRLVKENRKHFFRKDNDNTKLYLEDLSEGYRSNILLITDMVVKILGVGWTPKTIEGIVLIDEFDKHLHPKWQSRLVNQLTKTFPKIQFIMTTHNPMSILGRKAEEITMIKEIDGKIIAEKGEGTESMDVSNVLLRYFDVDSVVGKPMQDKIKRFNELRVKNDTNNEEYKRLNQEILNSEFGVLTLDSDYLEYLKSKKRNNSPQNRNFDNIGDFL